MSSFQRKIDLLNPDGKVSRWEMDNLSNPPPSNNKHGNVASAAKPASANSAQNSQQSSARDLQTARQQGFESGLEQGKKEALKQITDEQRKAGYSKGFEQGYAAAQADVKARTEALVAAELEPIKAVAAQFNEALNGLNAEIAHHLVELAETIGQQLALDTLFDKPEIINKVVSTLLEEEFAPASRPILLLHPKDLPLVENALGGELKAQGWQLKADDKILRGGCMARSNLTEIDARWESRCRSIFSRVRRRALMSRDETNAVTAPDKAAQIVATQADETAQPNNDRGEQ